LADEVERLWPVDHCVGYQTRVEGRSTPFVRAVVLNVRWIDQLDQDIHVEKEAGHGNSSRS
jgi:hypothetical protein